MSYVTIAELEEFLRVNNFVKTDDVRTLIQEQHATFEAIRHEIATSADQARGHASTFDTKYAEAVVKIQEIEVSQTKLLDHMKEQGDNIQIELAKMTTFNDTSRTSTSAAFADLEQRTAKFVAEREESISTTLEAKLSGADQRLNISMVNFMAAARAELGSSSSGGA